MGTLGPMLPVVHLCERRTINRLSSVGNVKISPMDKHKPVYEEVAYDEARARNYSLHHLKSLSNKISTWRERRLARAALTELGKLDNLLELATGTGRFWPVDFDVCPNAVFAMDNSLSMLREARLQNERQPHLICGSAFQLPLPDKSLDAVLCMRFLHHLYHNEDRMVVLAELARIARKGVVVSLWSDGNIKAGKRLQSQQHRQFNRGFGPRICIPQKRLEQEFKLSGFRVVSSRCLLSGVSMWRIYTLAIE